MLSAPRFGRSHSGRELALPTEELTTAGQIHPIVPRRTTRTLPCLMGTAEVPPTLQTALNTARARRRGLIWRRGSPGGEVSASGCVVSGRTGFRRSCRVEIYTPGLLNEPRSSRSLPSGDQPD